MRVEEGSKRVEGRRGGLSFHTHLTVTYLNPSGNRFNVKTITNQQMILNIILKLVKAVCHCLLTVVCLHDKSSSWAVLICHCRVCADSLCSSLVLYDLALDASIFDPVVELLLDKTGSSNIWSISRSVLPDTQDDPIFGRVAEIIYNLIH